jgi:hypothetical protein
MVGRSPAGADDMKTCIAAALVLAALTVAGCLGVEDGEYVYRAAGVDSVRVVSAVAPTVEFLVYGAFPTPCWDFTGTHVTETAPAVYSVSLLGRARRDRVCIALYAPFEREVEVDVPAPGDYRFEFVQPSAEPVRVDVHVE